MNHTPSTSQQPTSPQRGPGLAWIWGALGGGALGFGAGYVFYVLITPVLEASTGLVRELQGLSWNLVPALTLAGAVAGGLLVARWRR